MYSRSTARMVSRGDGEYASSFGTLKVSPFYELCHGPVGSVVIDPVEVHDVGQGWRVSLLSRELGDVFHE